MKDIVVSFIWGLCIFLNFLSASLNYQLDSSSSVIFNIIMACFCIIGLMIHLEGGGYVGAFNDRITNQITSAISTARKKKEKEEKEK